MLRGSHLVLKNVALISEFPVNLISLGSFQRQGFKWDHWPGKIRNKKTNRLIGTTKYHRHNNTYEVNQSPILETTYAFTSISNPKLSQKPRNLCRQSLATLVDADIWHKKMGHIGPLGLYKLGQECLEVRLRGKNMAQCPHCAVSKISQQVSRLSPANQATKPFYRVSIDWLDLAEGWDGYQGDGAMVQRVMMVVCNATVMAKAYYTTSSKEDENLLLTKDFVNWLKDRHKLEVKVIRSDNEMNQIKIKAWCRSQGITFETCAPDTHAQNGTAERFGRLIIEKARAMRLSANLPHKMWKKIVAAAIYLYNRTPRLSNGWKSPYEAFYTYVFNKEEVSGPRKPSLHHLKAYGCKAYPLIKSKSDSDYRPKKQKLDAKAHIGYLVGYESTNIFRIWIPHKKKVISTRDVIFDEREI